MMENWFVWQCRFEYEYEYRCTEYEYDEDRGDCDVRGGHVFIVPAFLRTRTQQRGTRTRSHSAMLP